MSYHVVTLLHVFGWLAIVLAGIGFVAVVVSSIRPANEKGQTDVSMDRRSVRDRNARLLPVLPLRLPAEQDVVSGALAPSYRVPAVTFSARRAVILASAITLLAGAIGWRLTVGLPVLLRATALPVIPLLGLRGFGWIASCFDKPHQGDPVLLGKLNVCITVPVYNEDPPLLDRCLFAIMNQTRRPQTVSIVDDGSTKVDYTELRAYWEGVHGPTTITWHRKENDGKRRAHCYTFSRHPEADIFVTVDSDTTLALNAVEEGLKPFADPRVHSVAGVELGYNAGVNFLTVMQSSLQQIAQVVVAAAWSVCGHMFTNRGPFALYRAPMIRDILPLYYGEEFYGHRVVLGDDSLLALCGSQYGRSVQQLSAFGLTMWPEKMSHHLRQRVRWARGRTIRNFWRLKYYSVRSYIFWFTLLSFYSFLASCAALVLLAVNWPADERAVGRVLAAMLALSWLSQVRILALRRTDETWLDRALVIAIRPLASIWASVVLTRVVRTIGMMTCLRQGWTTRQHGAELTLEPVPQPEMELEAVHESV